ncbi:hypothetical protein C8Q76DRAFT_238365 [Earliella scabrosa]|nr:hypothetical protein C8Q76DRAFT_238365 [Earliella scabrosa]
MESDTALLQVQTLRRVLAGNAKLLERAAAPATSMAGLRSQLEHLLTQVNILEDAVADSVSLLAVSDNRNRNLTINDPTFIMALSNNVQAALSDLASLQDPSSPQRENVRGMQIFAKDFAAGLIRNVGDILHDNFVMLAEHNTSTLHLSESSFAERLVTVLRHGLDAEHRVDELEDENATLNASNDELAEKFNNVCALKNSANAQLAVLRASSQEDKRSLEASRTEHARLRERVHALETQLQEATSTLNGNSASTRPDNGIQVSSIPQASRKRKERWNLFLDLPTWGLQLPPARARAVSALPIVQVKLPEGEDVLAVFTMSSLTDIIGTARRGSIFVQYGHATTSRVIAN